MCMYDMYHTCMDELVQTRLACNEMYFYSYLYPQHLSFLYIPLSIRRNRSACQLKFESLNSPIAN